MGFDKEEKILVLVAVIFLSSLVTLSASGTVSFDSQIKLSTDISNFDSDV